MGRAEDRSWVLDETLPLVSPANFPYQMGTTMLYFRPEILNVFTNLLLCSQVVVLIGSTHG